MLYSNCTINKHVSACVCITGLMGRVSSIDIYRTFFVCALQNTALPKDVEKVYDLRNDRIRSIVEIKRLEGVMMIDIRVVSLSTKDEALFTVNNRDNNLTEEDIFNFISTISFKD